MSRTRRTPPVAQQVIPPFNPTPALLQARLIDFDTASAELEQQHKMWLTTAMNRARTNSAFYVRIYGYASRLGNANYNVALAQERMNAVFNFLKGVDGRVLNSLEMWHDYGASKSLGGAKDDSPEYRAVEVHIFIGAMPPPPEPPGKRKVEPPRQPELPGGRHYGRWTLAAPGGEIVTLGPSIGPLGAGGAIGVNLFFIRNEETQERRNYACGQVGLGAGLGFPGLKLLRNVLQAVISGFSGSRVSFDPVYPKHPVTWAEIESCPVTITAATAGVGPLNASPSVVTFSCPRVWQYGPAGVFGPAEDIWSFNSSSEWAIGVGMTHTTGGLIRI